MKLAWQPTARFTPLRIWRDIARDTRASPSIHTRRFRGARPLRRYARAPGLLPVYWLTCSETVPASELRKGDVVRVEAGQIIPGDGEIVEGVASVDEFGDHRESPGAGDPRVRRRPLGGHRRHARAVRLDPWCASPPSNWLSLLSFFVRLHMYGRHDGVRRWISRRSKIHDAERRG